MPDLTFVLPHWLYWGLLVVFPLIAAYFVRRERRVGEPRRFSLPIVYFLWLTGGFVGLHRFYCRSWWGFIYAPLFIAILFVNTAVSDARVEMSEARNQIDIAEFELDRAKKALAEDGDQAAQEVEKQRRALEQAREHRKEATATAERLEIINEGLGIVIAALLVLDAFLLPWLTRRCREAEAVEPRGPAPDWTHFHAEQEETPREPAHLKVTRILDGISGYTGHFVAYWSVLAVFVYYYEVLARYVFNSPTNWAHESMFLMFGMQYLIAGAFALREDSHVRVDVIYMRFSKRVKAAIDVFTSIFFFIFCITLLVTGWTFAMDSVEVWEVSFTEWAVPYWPIKLAIPLGALLIVLQGLSKLIKDLAILTGREA